MALIGNRAGAVTDVRCVRIETGDPDPTGRASVQPVAGSEFEVPADVVFVAYGFNVLRLPQTDDFAKLAVDGQGCVVVHANPMTNFSGVFASGSVASGPVPLSGVVRGAGKTVSAIDTWLTARRQR